MISKTLVRCSKDLTITLAASFRIRDTKLLGCCRPSSSFLSSNCCILFVFIGWLPGLFVGSYTQVLEGQKSVALNR